MIHMNDPSLGRSFGDLWPKRSPSAVGKRNQIDVCFLTHETRGQAAGNPEQTAAGHGVYLLLCGRFPMSCIEVLVSRRYTRMRVHQYTRIQSARCNRKQIARSVFDGTGDLSCGRGDRTRTRNPRFWRPLLCQLSYSPKTTAKDGCCPLVYHHD